MSQMILFLMQKITTVLKKIERADKDNNYWIVGPETGRLLFRVVLVWRPSTIFEIGTSVGYSAIWMAAALEKLNSDGKLWTVESHKERHTLAESNIEEAGLGHRVVSKKGHAPEIFDTDLSLPSKIDLAFFDATKKDHQRFFEAVFPRMKSGGIILVDNVHSHRFGEMAKFIEKMHAHPGLETIEVSTKSGLLFSVLR